MSSCILNKYKVQKNYVITIIISRNNRLDKINLCASFEFLILQWIMWINSHIDTWMKFIPFLREQISAHFVIQNKTLSVLNDY